ncbi:hypothetical protein [Nocardioides gansuensis]|uniref:hypothetical protein n=1 Tax=Nocardioides gansuensis TaxID=2138300 RepID=UPI00105760BE|nr:hypothetical protein [Nocardioides gansuensis]
MVVEVVEFAPDRLLAELAAELEAQGGSLVVMNWRPGKPTTANVILPDDDARRAACRGLIGGWLMTARNGRRRQIVRGGR